METGARISQQTSVQAVDWTGGLEDAWSSIASFVPKLLIFLIILLIGWFIAKAVSKLLGVVLEKVGFDRLIDRAGFSRYFTGTFTPITLLTKLLYYFILLLALQLALTAFGPSNPVSDIVNDIIAWLPKAIVAIVIVVIAGAIASAVREILGGALGTLSYGGTLAKIVAGFIVALGVIAALNTVGIGLSVTLPVLVAVLATIGGILVVGVGGGLIGPMRQRWESWLGQIESDTAAVRHSQSGRGASTGSTTGSTTTETRTDVTDGGYYPDR